MKRKIKAGTTSVMEPIRIQDTSSSVGAGLAGIVYNSAGLTAKYRRKGDASWTAITLVTATAGTYTSGGFTAATGAPTGAYELHVPNAAVASGAEWCEVEIYGATNMLPVSIMYELDAVDYQDTVRFGMTSLPNAVAEAAGGLFTRGTGAGQITQTANGYIDVSVVRIANGTTAVTNLIRVFSTDFATVYTNGVGWITTLTAASLTSVASSVWNALTSGLLTVGSIGEWILAKLNATVGSRAIPGDAMALTPAERTATANEVENQIIDETDTEKVLLAITNKIAAANPDLSGLTLSAIAAAVRTNLAIELARLDTNVGSRSSHTAAQVVTALLTNLLSSTDFNIANSFGKLIKDNLDEAISTTLAADDYVAPDNAGIAAAAASAATAATEATGANSAAQTAAGRAYDAVTRITAVQNVAEKLDTMLDLDGATWVFTATALENSPAGAGSDPDVIAEAVDTLLSANHGADSWGATPSAGSDPVTINISVAGVPIPDADVWVTSDALGHTVVEGTYQTDSLGNATFMLTDGLPYYLWMQKDGENPIRGQLFTAEAD